MYFIIHIVLPQIPVVHEQLYPGDALGLATHHSIHKLALCSFILFLFCLCAVMASQMSKRSKLSNSAFMYDL